MTHEATRVMRYTKRYVRFGSSRKSEKHTVADLHVQNSISQLRIRQEHLWLTVRSIPLELQNRTYGYESGKGESSAEER